MKSYSPASVVALFDGVSFRSCASFALVALLALPGAAAAQSIASPSVAAGAAAVSGLGTTNVTVTQTSQKAVIDWRAFSVDAGSTVAFKQPGSSSITLNRVTGNAASQIDGSLTANGQIWLLNPNGVLVGASGRVSAGGFLATTHGIANEDFMSGAYRLTGDGAAGVTNLGSIVAADGGYAILAGNHVANAGLIQARLGQVALGAGKSFVLDVVGDRLLSFAVSEPLSLVAANGPLVSNTGTLSAQGGQVLLSARAAAGVVSGVVNTSGLIDATAVAVQGGTVVLDGGTAGEVDATGIIDTSGKGAGQTGGSIQLFGQTVVAGDGALLDARGTSGGGAIYLGGGWQGAAIGGHSSAIRAGVARTALLDASAIDSGNGGTVELWSDVSNSLSQTLALGTFLARGGANGGNGGRIETSGHYLSTSGAKGSAAAARGTGGAWLLDPYDIEIVADNSPAIVNPGFEDGLTGWTVTGAGGSATTAAAAQASSQSGGQTYSTAAPTGSQFALLTAGTQDSGNGVSQTFSGTAGQTFGLYALFLGKDYSPYLDTGTVTLTRPDGSVVTLYSQGIAKVGDYGTAPWKQQSITLDQTGTYQISAYATNVKDSAMPSQLGFELSTGAIALNGSFSASDTGRTWTATGESSKISASWIAGFLNSGTNVTITNGITEGGAQAGNITVNAAIAKTAGGRATLTLDATHAIAVNSLISSSSDALDVVLNSGGAGGIVLNGGVSTNGGNLTLKSSGTVTQMAAFNAATLTLGGEGGTYLLTNAANNFTALGGSAGSISLVNANKAMTLTDLAVVGSLAIAASGTINQTGALSASTLSLGGTNATYTLTNPGNTIGTLTGSAESIALFSQSSATIGNLAASNSLTVSSGGDLTITGALSVGVSSQLSATQRLTIADGATVTANSGTLQLSAGTNFINQAGGSAITTNGSARWLIYSQAPDNDTFGGLLSGNLAIWGTGQGALPESASVDTNGNRYVFASSPTILVSATDAHKTYGESFGTTGRAYVVSGLINAAEFGNVFLQDSISGTAAIASKGDGTTANVGSYGLSASRGSLTTPYGYNTVFESGTLIVDPRQLVLAATAADKVYDGSTATSNAPTVSGLVNGDTVTQLSERYDSRNAGSRTLAVDSGYVVNDGNGGANYTVSLQTASGTIAAKALTASLSSSIAKTYDGTTSATLTSGNYMLAGTVAGDTVTLNNPTAGNYDSKNVGTSKTVTVGGLALRGADAGNYTVNSSASAAIGNIAAKALTASLTGSVSKTYDGTTTATLTSGNYTLAGAVAGDTVVLNNPTAGSFDTKNVGTSKTVTASGFAVSGADAGNYTVNASASAAIGSIAAKALTASLTGSVSKTYDGTTTATLTSSNYALAGAVAGDTVALNNPTAGNYDTKNVGTSKIVTAGGLALIGADAGNYTVNAGASAAIGSIAAKALTASLTGSVSKTYDSTTGATLTAGNYALAGALAGDAVALNNPTAGNYDTKNVGTSKTVTAGGIALSGADAGNYTVNASASAAIGSIAAKTLTASLTGSVAKTYDGTTTAMLTSGNYTLAGAVAGDAVNLNNPTAGSYDTKNVGTAKTVTAGGLALSGADAGNYTVNASASAAIGSIAAKTLTASLTGSVAKTYDGTTSATLNSGDYALAGTVAGDTVALNNPTAGSYDTKNVGTSKTVTAGGLALSGADAGNYMVNASASAAIGSIAAKTLTASLTGSVSKTYDGTTSATLTSSNYALAGTVAGDTVALNNPTAGSYDSKNVGTAKTVTAGGLALSGADAGNYTVNASASAAIGSIAAKALTASLTGSVSKTYDGTIAATLSSSNYALAGTVAGDTVALNSPTAGSYDSKNVGTSKTVTSGGLALSGADAGNYTVNASASAAIGSIAAKALTASLTGSVSKTYDGTTSATLISGNYALAGAVAGDTVALNNPTAGSYASKNVGTAKTVTAEGLVLSGADASNYIVNASASAAIGSIAAKALTASLTGSISKTYDGTTTATLTSSNYALSGAVAGDTVALNNPTAGSYDSKNVGTSKTVTSGRLALSGADASNYTVNASASAAIGGIAAKALTASLTGEVSKTYDGTTSATLDAGNYALNGAVAGDAVALNNPTAGNYDTKDAGTSKTVTAGGLALSGADASNYTVNAKASAAIGSIAAKTLTASLTGSVAKTYDGTTTATLTSGNYTLAGTVAGDTVNLNNPTAGSYDSKNVGTTRTVTADGFVLSGADASNYTVNSGASAAIGSIAAKALTASLTSSVAKTYDGTVTATLTSGNYLLAGTVAGDTVGLNNPTTGSFDTKNVGASKTVTAGGLGLNGADAGNYTVNSSASAAIGSIAAKALTASLTGSVSKTYDGTIAATLTSGNYALAGTVAGDTVTLNNPTAGNYDSKNVGTSKTVTAGGLALSGADASNYTVNAKASAAIGSIAAKTLTASLTGSVAKTYDGTMTATLTSGNYALAGTVAGDTVNLNNPTAGSYDSKNVGTSKIVTAGGLALSGADAGNYTVNATASAAIGSVAAKALTASLIGTVVKTANGQTDAQLTPNNFLLTGFVPDENASVTKTNGDYASISAGTGLIVATSLAPTDFTAGANTDLRNYVLPVGAVSGAIGSINPSIIIVTQPVTTTPTAVANQIAEIAAQQPVLSPTTVQTPVTQSVDTPAVVAAASATSVLVAASVPITVDRSPPSPVPTQKPVTPVDAADAGDPILAVVSDKPARESSGSSTREAAVAPIAGGLLAQQRALPPRTDAVPGVDQSFSGGGSTFW